MNPLPRPYFYMKYIRQERGLQNQCRTEVETSVYEASVCVCVIYTLWRRCFSEPEFLSGHYRTFES
jgi:hypothetical protein